MHVSLEISPFYSMEIVHRIAAQTGELRLIFYIPQQPICRFLSHILSEWQLNIKVLCHAPKEAGR